jgi:hypothetical protein
MNSAHLRSLLLAAGGATHAIASSAAAQICEPLRIETHVESHAPFIADTEYAYGGRGYPVVSGDFNGDGSEDSVFSERGFHVPGNPTAGKIYIVYGSLNLPAQKITQGNLTSQVDLNNGGFGISMAVGDFNADGYDDLVASAAHTTFAGGTGRYFVIPGGANGLKPQQATDVAGQVAGDGNNAMTVGDFDRDGFDDIALGQSWWQGNCPTANKPYGRIVVAYSAGTPAIAFERLAATSTGLNGVQCGGGFASDLGSGPVQGRMRILAGQIYYSVPSPTLIEHAGSYLQFELSGGGIQQVAFDHAMQPNSYLGASFAFGDFDGDRRTDYAVGAFGNDVTPGWVRIGFARGASQVLSRAHFAGPLPESYTWFGAGLAAGNFDGDRMADLIIGEPRYRAGAGSDYPGAVLIARGSYLGNLQPVHTEIQVLPGAINRFAGNNVIAVDADNDGTDELLMGQASGQLDATHAYRSGFVTRTKFIGLDQCAPK